jgi:hypothetical protein
MCVVKEVEVSDPGKGAQAGVAGTNHGFRCAQGVPPSFGFWLMRTCPSHRDGRYLFALVVFQ